MSIALIRRIQMEIKKGEVLFVSSISSPQLHCTSAAPSSPSPLVSGLRAALMQEVWGLSVHKGATLSHVHPSHGTEVHPNGLCVFYFSKCFGDPLGFFRKSSDPFFCLPTMAQQRKVSFKQVVSPRGSLLFHGGCASVYLRD